MVMCCSSFMQYAFLYLRVAMPPRDERVTVGDILLMRVKQI